MVTRRTTESVNQWLPRKNAFGAFDRRLCRPIDRLPGAGGDRTGGIGGVVAKLADDSFRPASAPAAGVIVGYGRPVGPKLGTPARPGRLQEADVVCVVHCKNRRQPVISRRGQEMSVTQQAVTQQDRTLRLFRMGHKGAPAEVALRPMQQLPLIENESHGSREIIALRRPVVQRPCGAGSPHPTPGSRRVGRGCTHGGARQRPRPFRPSRRRSRGA